MGVFFVLTTWYGFWDDSSEFIESLQLCGWSRGETDGSNTALRAGSTRHLRREPLATQSIPLPFNSWAHLKSNMVHVEKPSSVEFWFVSLSNYRLDRRRLWSPRGFSWRIVSSLICLSCLCSSYPPTNLGPWHPCTSWLESDWNMGM